MKSIAINTGSIELPLIEGEFQMIPFNISTFEGLYGKFLGIAKEMMKGIRHKGGTAYFTIHGKKLKKGQTLRRGGAHIDGNYEPNLMDFGGSGGSGGWKIGEEGRPVGHPVHERQFTAPNGGIVLASNYQACNGWIGEYDGIPQKGGDCTHFELDEPFPLVPNRVYYANNHFIHESLPMSDDVHRVFARITMPEDHEYQTN